MMKKVLAILMIAVLAISLTGCFGKSSSSSTEPTTAPKELSYYTGNGFFGLQQYLVDHGFVTDVDLSKYDPASTNEPADTTGARSAVYYDLVGANNGVRLYLAGGAFVELYDFSNPDNDTAKQFLADIKKNDGKITVEGNPDEVTCVISASGKIVMLYNPKKSYEYDKIIEALKNW